ncbi:hypothetical protein CsSME_00037830 [Camellia sinensis var. sinensis]
MGITFLVVVYACSDPPTSCITAWAYCISIGSRPDSLGSNKVFLHSKIPSSVEGQYILSLTVEEEAIKGEIFGGIYLSSDSNDGEILMESLGKCCSCSSNGQMKACHGSEQGQNSIPNLLSTINGPWALIYWQASSRAIWFGRDAFGRRSLLVHWPTFRLLLTSVSPPHSIDKSSGCNAWRKRSLICLAQA